MPSYKFTNPSNPTKELTLQPKPRSYAVIHNHPQHLQPPPPNPPTGRTLPRRIPLPGRHLAILIPLLITLATTATTTAEHHVLVPEGVHATPALAGLLPRDGRYRQPAAGAPKLQGRTPELVRQAHELRAQPQRELGRRRSRRHE